MFSWISWSDSLRPIFRDMVNIGKGVDQKPIELDDEEIESAEILKEIFKILIDGGSLYDTSHEKVGAVVGFLRKYDCKNTLATVRMQLWAALAQEKCETAPLICFIQATHLDDHDLCCKILSTQYGLRWGRANGGSSDEEWGVEMAGMSVFDPSAMGQSDQSLVPKDAFWAWQRASRKADFSKPKPTGLKEMGEEYLRLMKLRGESSPSGSGCLNRFAY